MNARPPSLFLQRHGLSAAGSRPVLFPVPASGSGAPYCSRDAVGASPIARATAAQAFCAATSKAGSRRTTIARAISVCCMRPARASGARSNSCRTSHVAMVWSASRVAAAPVSSASGSIAFPLLHSSAVHRDDAGNHLPGAASRAAPALRLRRILGAPLAHGGRFLPACRGLSAPALFFRASAYRRQASGGCAQYRAAYLPQPLRHLSVTSRGSEVTTEVFADVQKVFAECANA